MNVQPGSEPTAVLARLARQSVYRLFGFPAEGRTKPAIAGEPVVTEGAIEKAHPADLCVAADFAKLGLAPDETQHRG